MPKRLLPTVPLISPSFLIAILFLLIGSIGRVQAQAPANDECTGAVTLTSSMSLNYELGNTVAATQSLGAIACSGYIGTADDDIWFKFVAVASKHTVTIIGDPATGFDAVVDVRSGACNGATIACTNTIAIAGAQTLALPDLIIGNTYYIRVYSFGNAPSSRGLFGIAVTHINDDCGVAILLTSTTPNSATITAGTTVGATQSLPAITCGTATGTADDDVWYKFVAVSTMHIVTVIGNTDSGFDAVVDVRSGACNGTSIGCADATAAGGKERVGLSGLTIGNTYYIRIYSVGSISASRGNFEVNVTHEDPPANDNCTGAITLTSAIQPTGAVLGTTGGATQSLPAITCGAATGTADDDVWYKFVAVSHIQTVLVIGFFGFDPVVDVRSGACNGTNIGCADATAADGTETVNFSNLIPGNTYYVRVYSRGATVLDRGGFVIAITHIIPPANDECANAIALTSATSPSTTNGTTVDATQSLAAITCSNNTGTADDDVWYKFVAVSVEHTITVTGNSGFNPVIDVRSGACNGTSIGCANPTGNSEPQTVTVSGLTIGSTYYIRVYSFGASASNSGTFAISVTHEIPPANDECTNAITLISSTGISGVVGTTIGATQSLGAITCNALTGTADDDVWYKFVAVSNKHNIAVIGGPEVDVVVDIRSGACNGTTIACSDATKEAAKEEMTLSNLIIGNTYYIRVYSFGTGRTSRGLFGILVNHEECPATANITNPITSGTVTMKATQITANNQVSGSVVTYRGVQSVTLQPGFSAVTGAGNYFVAGIGGCP